MPVYKSNRMACYFLKGYFLLFSFIFFVVVQCSTTPTGRKQVQLLPDQQMARMGDQAYEQMRKESQILPPTSNAHQTVTCIAQALLSAMGEDSNQWQITVFQNATPNAFALPGKNIGVHTGMVEFVDNIDQLAAVMGHEIGHVKAHHGNERASQQLLVQGGLAVADIYLGKDQGTDQLLLGALGLGAKVGVLLPFSRKHEAEADELGLEYMAKAGFAPKRASDLWIKMAKKSGGQPPEFLSTHPSADSRAKRLSQLAADHQGVYNDNASRQDCQLKL